MKVDAYVLEDIAHDCGYIPRKFVEERVVVVEGWCRNRS